MRKAISVTLTHDNLLWLRGQAARTRKGSVSETLDALITSARSGGRTAPDAIRSVVGTIDLPEDDPDLLQADEYVRSLFAASARRPILVRERPPKAGRKTRRG